MGRIHDGQTSVKVRSPPKNIGGYGTVSVWRSAHFYRPDRDRLQSLPVTVDFLITTLLRP